MRRVNVRTVCNPVNSVLLSLNRFFYILKPTDSQALLSTETTGYKVFSKIERVAIQHFEVFEEQNWLVATDESHKFVNFYALNEVFTALPGTFPTAKHQQ